MRALTNEQMKRRAEARMVVYDGLPSHLREQVGERNAIIAQMLAMGSAWWGVRYAEPPAEGRLYRKRRRM